MEKSPGNGENLGLTEEGRQAGNAAAPVQETQGGMVLEKQFEQFMAVVEARHDSVGSDMAIAEKLTPEHITQVLEGSREQMRNEFAEKKSKRRYSIIYLALAMIFVLAVILILKDSPDVMENVIYALGGLLTGGLGGYGIGTRKKDDE